MNPRYAALLGFLFVAACFQFNFGDAVVCLIGAVGFYVIAAAFTGELDLGEVQQKARSRAR